MSGSHLGQRFLYGGLIALAFALLVMGKADIVLMERVRTQVTDALTPVLGAVSRPLDTVNGWIFQGRELFAIREENARLRADRARLLHWQAVARKLEAENTTLQGLLGLVPEASTGFTTARVIAVGGGAFVHSLIVDAGDLATVRKGQAVITGEGLVGRVAHVGQRSSQVLLLTDLNSRIPVIVESTRAQAILAGNNSDSPSLVYLTPGTTVEPGDRLVTSGDGGVFPAGLPVGLVASVSEGLIQVQPFVERYRLEFVRIVDYGLHGVLETPGGAFPSNARGRK